MPDIQQLTADLRGLPDQALQQELSQPTGTVPSYLVLAEAQRRQLMRQAAQKQATEGQSGTVLQDVVRNMMAQQPAPGPPAPAGMVPPRQGPLQMADGGTIDLGSVEDLTPGIDIRPGSFRHKFDLGDMSNLVNQSQSMNTAGHIPRRISLNPRRIASWSPPIVPARPAAPPPPPPPPTWQDPVAGGLASSAQRLQSGWEQMTAPQDRTANDPAWINQKTQGASDVLRGAAPFVAPLMVPAAVAAPLPAAVGLAGGWLAGTGTEYLAGKAGVPSGEAALAGDVAAMAAPGMEEALTLHPKLGGWYQSRVARLAEKSPLFGRLMGVGQEVPGGLWEGLAAGTAEGLTDAAVSSLGGPPPGDPEGDNTDEQAFAAPFAHGGVLRFQEGGDLEDEEPLPDEETFPEETPSQGGASRLMPDYSPYLDAAEKKYSLPHGMIQAVQSVESSHERNPERAVSSAGAKGLMQFMPNTGPRYGLKTDSDYFNPALSADAGGHYLSDLLHRYGGNQSMAIAAYNVGPDKVDRLGITKPGRDYLRLIGKAGFTPGLPSDSDIAVYNPNTGQSQTVDQAIKSGQTMLSQTGKAAPLSGQTDYLTPTESEWTDRTTPPTSPIPPSPIPAAPADVVPQVGATQAGTEQPQPVFTTTVHPGRIHENLDKWDATIADIQKRIGGLKDPYNDPANLEAARKNVLNLYGFEPDYLTNLRASTLNQLQGLNQIQGQVLNRYQNPNPWEFLGNIAAGMGASHQLSLPMMFGQGVGLAWQARDQQQERAMQEFDALERMKQNVYNNAETQRGRIGQTMASYLEHQGTVTEANRKILEDQLTRAQTERDKWAKMQVPSNKLEPFYNPEDFSTDEVERAKAQVAAAHGWNTARMNQEANAVQLLQQRGDPFVQGGKYGSAYEQFIDKYPAEAASLQKPPAVAVKAFDLNDPNDKNLVHTTYITNRPFIDGRNYKGKLAEEMQRRADATPGVTFLGKDQAVSLGHIEDAQRGLDSMERAMLPFLPRDPTGHIIAENFTVPLKKLTQLSPVLASWGAWRTQAIAALRAAAGSEGLRINEAEIKQAVENDIPTENDTVGTAMNRLAIMRRTIQNQEDSIFHTRIKGGAPAPDLPVLGPDKISLGYVPAADWEKYKAQGYTLVK